MAVNCPVAAEEQDHVRFRTRGRQADAPFDLVIVPMRLEWLKVTRRTSQPEDGRGAHWTCTEYQRRD
jgi:hypothetical protein